MLQDEKSSCSLKLFCVFSLRLFVFQSSRLAPSQACRAIALLALSLTPCALKCGLLSCNLISIFIVYQPWGSILAWMLLQMNTITGEPSHPDCIEKLVEESLVDYCATRGWSTNTTRQTQLQLLALTTCTLSYLTKTI